MSGQFKQRRARNPAAKAAGPTDPAGPGRANGMGGIHRSEPMDLWLRKELQRLYGDVVDEPLPPSILELLWAYESYELINAAERQSARKEKKDRKH